MKEYYVVDVEDEDFDLDSETAYRTYDEAKEAKTRLEMSYIGSEYRIWEVD